MRTDSQDGGVADFTDTWDASHAAAMADTFRACPGGRPMGQGTGFAANAGT